MTRWHTYSFDNERVSSLVLPVETNHRPNNPIPESNAEFTILVPTCKYRRTQTQNLCAFNLKLRLHTISFHTLTHMRRWTNTRHMHWQNPPKRWPLTCDEIAKLRIEASIVVRAGEASYNVISGDALLQGDIVHSRVEGRRLIVNIQNWGAHTNAQNARWEETGTDVYEDK